MKTAVIVHGTSSREEYYDSGLPSASNYHWLPWLQKQLIVHDYAVYTPEIPNSWAPHYPTWKKEFERFEISSETALVGHSCGGGFLTRWLSEHADIRVGKVVLVAPWLDPKRTKTTDFFDFVIDPALASRTSGLTIFNSDNDGQDVQNSVSLLRAAIHKIQYREFHNYGHFCLNDMRTSEFPELLAELLNSDCCQ